MDCSRILWRPQGTVLRSVTLWLTGVCFITLVGQHVGVTAEYGCRTKANGHHYNRNLSSSRFLNDLFANYDSLVRPGYGEGATNVTCDLFINSMDSISVDTMEASLTPNIAANEWIVAPTSAADGDYSLNIYMRQTWEDPRLRYHSEDNVTKVTLDHKLYSYIWVPDLFFPNEKKSHIHCVTVPNSMIRIHSDGTVLYSARYTLSLACHMNLRHFPLDKQTCFMRIESYGYTTDELQLSWREESPIQINEELELPQFNLKEFKVNKCNKSYVTGSFACLRLDFLLERQYGYYMIQTYIPSLLIVSLSWVSFWINIDAVPARISLGVLTVLTLTTQSVGVWMSLPRVSYIKAIDIWMSMCVVLVFAAMLEFAIVNTLARKEIRQMSMKARNTSAENDGVMPSDMIKRMMDEYQYGSPKRFDPNSRLLARKVDKVARKLFPTFFALFNLAYWCVFLLQ